MPALTNPRDTAEGTWGYSSDGSSYTDFTDVVDAIPDPFLCKIIERMLVTGTKVEKFPSRFNHGKLKIVCEYSSALFNVVNGIITNKTAWYLRYTWGDTGGTAGSKQVYYGYLESLTPPGTSGDNKVAQFEFVLAVRTFTFTAGS